MSLAKFKICPACEEHNPPSLLECQKCEADLTSVKIVDGILLQNRTNTSANKEANTSGSCSELVKQCDCGMLNPPQARKCSSCNEDISDIRPAALQPTNKISRFFLRAIIDEDYSFELEKAVTIIGREANMKDYLAVKSYVSRQHAKFTIVNGDIYLEDLSTTNHTFVNNLLIASNVPTLLKNGDEIGVGGKLINDNRQQEAAYFIFEIIS